MAVKARCPHCQALFQVAREKIGLKAKCNNCGMSFRLTAQPDDAAEREALGAVADMEEARGFFGLPRWSTPAAILVVLLGLLGYFTIRALSEPMVRIEGPSPEVAEILQRAHRFLDAGQHEVAINIYRDAIAHTKNKQVIQAIQEELAQVKQDADLKVVISDIVVAKELDSLPDGPPLDPRQRTVYTSAMRRTPSPLASQTLLQLTCRIDRSLIDRETMYDDDPATEFKAKDFTAIDTDGTRYEAAGFKINDRYFHRRLIIEPPAKDSQWVEVGVIFEFPVSADLLRVMYKDTLSTRVFKRKN